MPVQRSYKFSFRVECRSQGYEVRKGKICLESRQGFSLPILEIILTVFLEQKLGLNIQNAYVYSTSQSPISEQ